MRMRRVGWAVEYLDEAGKLVRDPEAHLPEKRIGREPALGVAVLGPGIGEIQMYDIHFLRRKPAVDESGVIPDQKKVVCSFFIIFFRSNGFQRPGGLCWMQASIFGAKTTRRMP